MKRITLLVICLFLMLGNARASEIGLLKHLDVDGIDYVERTDLTTVLLLGTDERQEQGERVRRGAQADFILLVILDHGKKQIRTLQIDRDTVTAIPTVDVFGRRNGTRETQLCLAHSMMGGKTGCEFTREAVSELLLGVDIDLYASISLDGIGLLNDVLGGVTMTLTEDYTTKDPELMKGKTITLTAQQAELVVRSRMGIGDGTNAGRMERQRAFLDAAAKQCKQRLRENVHFADVMLDALDCVMVTDMTRGRMVNEINRIVKYDILPAERLAGEYMLGGDGFKEFHPDREALREWVLENLFVPNK